MFFLGMFQGLGRNAPSASHAAGGWGHCSEEHQRLHVWHHAQWQPTPDQSCEGDEAYATHDGVLIIVSLLTTWDFTTVRHEILQTTVHNWELVWLSSYARIEKGSVNHFLPALFFFFFWVEISLCTPIPLFQGTVNNGVGSWDHTGESSLMSCVYACFPDRFSHYA